MHCGPAEPTRIVHLSQRSFPSTDLLFSLRYDPLAEPLSRKPATQNLQILHDISARAHDGVFGANSAICGNAHFELGEERVWDFVCGEYDVVIFVEARREQVAERVVFFIKDEGSGVRNAFGTR